jgi:hypothetical protein
VMADGRRESQHRPCRRGPWATWLVRKPPNSIAWRSTPCAAISARACGLTAGARAPLSAPTVATAVGGGMWSRATQEEATARLFYRVLV